ncbi:MAG: glycosyltransferase [Clostridia bacterium]|nr:glycosyltransferase [Clostridia bacterium]
MKEDLISVVVPIYNVENYLNKCVTSIINQSYTNLEIILVDDGSSDGCPSMCDNFKSEDSRIIVIHKENGGLSDARNAGIDIAKGKYITFVDSDDYIEKDMIEILYKTATTNSAQISTCMFKRFEEGETPKANEEGKLLVLSNEEALQDMMYQKNCTTSAWAKLYDMSLFDGIRYPKGKICEDLPTTYLLFSKAKTIVLNTSEKYYYLQRKNSIINSKFKLARMDALQFAVDETEYIEKNHSKIINSAINREFMEAVFILIQIPLSKEYKSEIKKIRNCIHKNRFTVLTDGMSKRKIRLLALISYLGIFNLKHICNFVLKNKKG